MGRRHRGAPQIPRAHAILLSGWSVPVRPHRKPSEPVLHPGITTNLLAFGGVSPDPLETCGWKGDKVGLPLIALLTQAPTPALTASLNGPTGTESSNAGTLCVVDQNTYHSSDAVYAPTGLSILQGDNAVVLVPRRRLVNGSYSVDISQPGAPDIRWSFNAAPSTIQRPSPKRRRRSTIRSIAVRGHTVTIHLAAPAGAPLRCALEPRSACARASAIPRASCVSGDRLRSRLSRRRTSASALPLAGECFHALGTSGSDGSYGDGRGRAALDRGEREPLTTAPKPVLARQA